jgi:hypothetical protein
VFVLPEILLLALYYFCTEYSEGVKNAALTCPVKFDQGGQTVTCDLYYTDLPAEIQKTYEDQDQAGADQMLNLYAFY